MQDFTAPRLAKWPFFLGNILLLALAWFVYHQSKLPMGGWQILACVVCVSLGTVLSIWPFVLEYRSAEKLLETATLTTVVAQVQNIEQVASQISTATAQWQSVQEAAVKTAGHAKEIAHDMAQETKAFTDFLQRANDSERSTLRLEVDKLRRIEAEWLQVLVRILDHVHALNRAAAQSRQPNVIEQLGRFQSACHDAARRVGLTPFVAGAEETFNAERHQVLNAETQPVDGAALGETVANGYTFQGRLLRPAIVRLRDGNGNENGNGSGNGHMEEEPQPAPNAPVEEQATAEERETEGELPLT